MKKATAKKLQLSKMVICRLNNPRPNSFWGEPGQSTLPQCDTIKPPTEKTGLLFTQII